MSSPPSGSDASSDHAVEQILEERRLRQAVELRAEAAELRAEEAELRAEAAERATAEAERAAAAAELRAAAAVRLVQLAPIIAHALAPPWLEVGLTLAFLLPDVLLLAATFVMGCTLAPVIIMYSSWRCRDLLRSPQRQWRGVMAMAIAVACVATASQAVGVACCTVCGLLLLTRAAFIIKPTLVWIYRVIMAHIQAGRQ